MLEGLAGRGCEKEHENVGCVETLDHIANHA